MKLVKKLERAAGKGLDHQREDSNPWQQIDQLVEHPIDMLIWDEIQILIINQIYVRWPEDNAAWRRD